MGTSQGCPGAGSSKVEVLAKMAVHDLVVDEFGGRDVVHARRRFSRGAAWVPELLSAVGAA